MSAQTISTRKPNSSANLLFIALLVAATYGCSAPKREAVSEDGRTACMEEVASTMLIATQQQKQKKFRECLRTIDARLAAMRKQAAAQQEEERATSIKKNQQLASTWESPRVRLNHCKLIQDEVIQLDKDRIRAYARVIGSTSSNSSPSEVEQFQQEYSDIIRRLDQLIPPAMRANWELVPDALERFKRCDPADFTNTAVQQ